MENISPLHIAKYLLKMSEEKADRGRTPIHLNKITYIAHGHHLGFLDSPLITNGEFPQAWKYGPVYKSIYDRFSIHGYDPVPFTDFKHENYNLDYESLNENTKKIIKVIWDIYSVLSGNQLIAITHEKGTPWDTVWRKKGGRHKKGVVIPDSVTYAYYHNKRSDHL